ncbi:protein SEC13 homolog isoform X1 [Phascolarctos cinereus]|uniref:Protein SEC13 homolog n=1 Tax=Phascolarctos cinereus TaxID=38626 RepID=A0A6P5JQV5_PHACI|nr:protein SEC13 homolog isoform X1 [Phascolarctos cinereus]
MVSVINTVDTSHEDMIHDAQMDYYGTRLATCSSDRSVKIFDVRNGGQILIADLRGHEGPVWQVAWAHPMYGNILASCSYDRKVIIWKEENGTWEKTYEYTGHDSSVNSVCWAPHDYGFLLACGSSDGAISLLSYGGEGQWEVKKINNAHTIGCNAVSWAPAVIPGSLVDQPSGQKPNYIKKFASGGCDNLVKLWKEEEDGQWKEDQKLEAHSDWVRDVAWAPSIGLPTSTIASCSQDGRVFIWTCDDASGNTWSPRLLHKFNDVVWHVSWSITANILAVSGGDNKNRLSAPQACTTAVASSRASLAPFSPRLQSIFHAAWYRLSWSADTPRLRARDGQTFVDSLCESLHGVIQAVIKPLLCIRHCPWGHKDGNRYRIGLLSRRRAGRTHTLGFRKTSL